MQDKRKVTLYLSTELHHQLKVQSAIDETPMSDLAEQAIAFYLNHSEVVETIGAGHVHRVYGCPTCTQPVVLRNGELISVGGTTSVLPILEETESQLVTC